MSILSNCKINPDCNIVIPIDDRANIGSTLSAISLNFTNLDNTLCNLTTSATEYWNPTYEEFNTLKPQWEEMLNVIQTYSSCWNDTYDTVNTLSSFWLKPISLVYPYPFISNTEGVSDLVEAWLNENFPPKVGNCFNFIVGQELYVFTPEYSEINRNLVSSQTVRLQPRVSNIRRRVLDGGAMYPVRAPTARQSADPRIGPHIEQNGNTTTVTVVGKYSCISRVYSYAVKLDFIVDSTVGVVVPDKFIETIVGLKFTINPTTYTWEFVENLFNIS